MKNSCPVDPGLDFSLFWHYWRLKMCHWIAKVPLFLGHSPKFDQWYRQQNSKTVSISSIGLQNYQFQDLCKNRWASYFNTSCKNLTFVSYSVRKLIFVSVCSMYLCSQKNFTYYDGKWSFWSERRWLLKQFS